MDNKERKILDDLINFENDSKWFFKEVEVRKEELKGKYVLVKDRNIVVVKDSFDEIKEEASKLEIDIEKSLVQFIPKEDITLII